MSNPEGCDWWENVDVVDGHGPENVHTLGLFLLQSLLLLRVQFFPDLVGNVFVRLQPPSLSALLSAQGVKH